MSNTSFSDNILLQEADALLKDTGFSTCRGALALASSEVPWLLAEDRFFILAVIAFQTLLEAQQVEPFAARELLERLASSDIGAKRWDVYLVLLAEQDLKTPQQTREVIDLQYNTHGIRRLVATNVADRAALRVALRSFLPLPPVSPDGLGDALEELSDQLNLNGISEDAARRYVAAFAQSGDLDDI